MPKAEKKVYNALIKSECEAFLPLYKKVVQWSDRKKKLMTPLFPNYVFANLGNKDLYKASSIPGFIRFLCTKGKRDIVSQNEIDTIQQMMDCNPEVSNEDFVVGQAVIVERGALKGVSGKVVNKRGGTKIIVELTSLKLNLMAEISSEEVGAV